MFGYLTSVELEVDELQLQACNADVVQSLARRLYHSQLRSMHASVR
jgi:hypothetical protein